MQGYGPNVPPEREPTAIRLRELGEYLKRERETQRRTIDDAAQATKVRGRYLRAIEDGDLRAFPGVVYMRGFIGSYADYLGLDGKTVVRQYLGRAFADSEPATPPARAGENPSESPAGPVSAVSKSVRAMAARLPESAGGVSRRSAASRRKVPHRPDSPAPVGRSGAVLGTSAAVIALVTVITVAHGLIGNGHFHGGGATPAKTASGAAPQNPSGPSGGSGRVVPPRMAPALRLLSRGAYGSKFGVRTNRPLTLTVTGVSGRCWVEVWGDGRVLTLSSFVNQGQTVHWTAGSALKILVGASSRIAMNVNGIDVSMAHATGGYTYSFVRQ